MLYSAQDLVFSASLAVYVAVSVVIACVRWGHKCEPFSKHMDYYYPAWKVLVWCYMSAVLLTPCIFSPQDPDSVAALQIMLILTSPYYSAVIMFTYFGNVLKLTWWKKPIYALSFPFGYILLTVFAHAMVPGTQMEGTTLRIIVSVSGVLAIVYLLCFIMSFVMVLRAMHQFSIDNYSNPDDFPNQYASRVIYLPILHIGISWIGSLVCGRWGLSVAVLAQSVLNVVFLIGALSPHRARDLEGLNSGERTQIDDCMEAEDSAPIAAPVDEEEEDIPISQAKGRAILKKLRHLVEDEQAFLDSHLTLASLSRSCGVNRTYLSRVMNENLGGFFRYVNQCRLNYADELKVQHPDMSVDDLALASGFGSRQSYYNIRRSLNQ